MKFIFGRRTTMSFKVNALVFTTVILLLTSMAAQTDSAPPLARAVPEFGPMPMTVGVSLRTELMDAEPVKGVPFCATILTEHTQAFADGNRIHTTDSSMLCRDTEGRTRRETSLTLLRPAAENPPMKLITIIDPVAGFRYVLDTNAKIARKMPLPSTSEAGPGTANAGAKEGNVFFYRTGGAAGAEVSSGQVIINRGQTSDAPAATTDNLGDQTIDGIHATGTRVTTIIPSGKMGNEQPITITSERWYSQELKATVMTKHSDPWAGELKTQFTNLNTAEPDPSLFSVPSDYKTVDEKAGPFRMQVPPPPPPAP
jgi:hypothetical protein